MFDEHTLIFVASKIEISYKAKKHRFRDAVLLVRLDCSARYTLLVTKRLFLLFEYLSGYLFR